MRCVKVCACISVAALLVYSARGSRQSHGIRCESRCPLRANIPEGRQDAMRGSQRNNDRRHCRDVWPGKNSGGLHYSVLDAGRRAAVGDCPFMLSMHGAQLVQVGCTTLHSLLKRFEILDHRGRPAYAVRASAFSSAEPCPWDPVTLGTLTSALVQRSGRCSAAQKLHALITLDLHVTYQIEVQQYPATRLAVQWLK